MKLFFDHIHWDIIITWGPPRFRCTADISSSLTVVGFRVIAVLLLQVSNGRKEEFTAGIALIRLASYKEVNPPG